MPIRKFSAYEAATLASELVGAIGDLVEASASTSSLMTSIYEVLFDVAGWPGVLRARDLMDQSRLCDERRAQSTTVDLHRDRSRRCSSWSRGPWDHLRDSVKYDDQFIDRRVENQKIALEDYMNFSRDLNTSTAPSLAGASIPR